MSADGAGESLGSGYVLLDEIGAGAMGTVWRARHRDTGETVAVKLLREGLGDDQDLVLRFVQERNVMRALRHPNIVAIRDFVVEGRRLAPGDGPRRRAEPPRSPPAARHAAPGRRGRAARPGGRLRGGRPRRGRRAPGHQAATRSG
ncbi:protein kinase domain-containing protein [Microbispora siamensis]